MNRREFLKWCGLSGVALLMSRRAAWPWAQTPTGLKKFVQALPLLGPTGIPAAVPDTATYPGIDYYRIRMADYTHQFHPSLPASRVRGYADVTAGQVPNHRYLGGLIVAQSGRPVKITAVNNLSATHPLPVDRTVAGVGMGTDDRAVIHLHGGFVSWESDGVPMAWVAPNGMAGESFMNPGANPGEADHFYPNQQTARLMWYHDHAMGITRLNAYAGMAAGYVLRDATKQALIGSKVIPSREIPLIIQDKTFVSQAAINNGYTWGAVGDLWYPDIYEKDPGLTMRWNYGPDLIPPASSIGPLPVPSVVPEFSGDTTVINGAAFPFLKVQQRHYRFRILNGSQARVFNLQLYYAKPAKPKEANLRAPGPRIIQIGNEGGFLPEPVALNNPPVRIGYDLDPTSATFGNAVFYNLLLGPAERADVIIDFSRIPAGSRLILYNDAPSPFPMGDPRNDYYTGAPDLTSAGGAPTPLAGFGPNTRTLMQFRVVPRVGAADPPSMNILEKRAVRKTGPNPLAGANPLPAYTQADAVRTRDLTLNEDFDEYGRAIQFLGTNVSIRNNTQGIMTFARSYMDLPTESPNAGDIEVWRIANLTPDTHPVHFHLANIQLLERRPFWVLTYKGSYVWMGPGRGPDANEMGWKETIRMNPGEVTTILVRWDLPTVPYAVPLSPRTGGHEYVWHCHILEHEEHEMMRPLVVNP